MTVTRSNNQVRSHRTWKILLTVVVALMLAYYLFQELASDDAAPQAPAKNVLAVESLDVWDGKFSLTGLQG